MGSTSDAAVVVPLPWAERSSAMPYLPGGAENQVEALKLVLDSIQHHDGDLTATVELGEGAARTLKEAIGPLRSSGMVEDRGPGRIGMSQEAHEWHLNPSPAGLLAILHRNIQFVGECLVFLGEGPKKMGEIQSCAHSFYDLDWATLDQVRRRISWFRSMELAEYKTTKLIGLTEKGEDLLPGLQVDPERARVPASAPSSQSPREVRANFALELPAPIQSALSALDDQSLSARHSTLGYLPQGQKSGVMAVHSLIQAAENRISREKYTQFAADEFGISESSFNAALSTLMHMGLIEETGYAEYSPSSLGMAWLQKPTALNLVLILHTRFRYVLELISALHEHAKAPALAREAKERYRLHRTDVQGTRKRLQFLKAAGLIEERSNWRYQPTPLGEEIVHSMPLEGFDEPAEAVGVGVEDEQSEVTLPLQALGRKLVDAGTHADDPTMLERATAEALQALGFQAKVIGGSGSTDVLATFDQPSERPIRIIIDAKSARAGDVSENAVHFDTLSEHKVKHGADQVAVIGPGFERGRLKQRARNKDVRLITTSELAEALIKHESAPLSAHHYVGLLSAREDAAQDTHNAWRLVEAQHEVFQKVVSVLAAEAQDPDEVTHGTLTSDQIYLMIRNDMDPRPSPTDIQAALSMLEHPFVDAVSSSKGRYGLSDSPALIWNKLKALSRPLAENPIMG